VEAQGYSPFLRFTVWRRSTRAIGVVVVLGALVSGCSDAPSTNTSAGNAEARPLLVGVPESDRDSSDLVLQQVWRFFSAEGLTARGSDGRPRGNIADSWSVSPDGLEWRLNLRSGVQFHDASAFDAEAAKAALERAMSRPGTAALYPGLLDVHDVLVEGDRTLIIKLTQPSAFLLDDLDIPLTKPVEGGFALGTGPYYPVSVSETEVKLRAHAAYHLGRPVIADVVFKGYPTLRQAWASLLRGEIEAVWNVSGDALEFLTDQTAETFTFPRHYAYVMAFNSERPQLRSSAVRRALNASVDRGSIVNLALKGRGAPAFSPIWPGHWAYDSSVAGYSYDPSLARATLNAFGLKKPGRLTFSCLVPSDHAIFERLALVLQRQLLDVGVDLQLESVPLSDFDSRLRRGNFDAALLDLASGPSLSRVYQFWRSSGEFQGLNVFGYRNVSVDRWLDRLRSTSDGATTRAATSQLQRAMMEDPPALFLAWSQKSRVISRRIKLPQSPGRDPFQTLWQWSFNDGTGSVGGELTARE
jgi:peptide/nickel transport system substrate-binding protein